MTAQPDSFAMTELGLLPAERGLDALFIARCTT